MAQSDKNQAATQAKGKGIGRLGMQVAVTIADGAALSEAIYMEPFAGGMVYVPDSWSAANLGFKVCDTEGGTFAILKDASGVPIQISGMSTSGAMAYQIPDGLFGAVWVKLWSKSTTAATETDVNQTGAISPVLMLKS
jgi:hypothetical protein